MFWREITGGLHTMNLSHPLETLRGLFLFVTEGLALMCLGAFIYLYFWFLGWSTAAFVRGHGDPGNFLGSVLLGVLFAGICLFIRRTKRLETVHA